MKFLNKKSLLTTVALTLGLSGILLSSNALAYYPGPYWHHHRHFHWGPVLAGGLVAGAAIGYMAAQPSYPPYPNPYPYYDTSYGPYYPSCRRVFYTRNCFIGYDDNEYCRTIRHIQWVC